MRYSAGCTDWPQASAEEGLALMVHDIWRAHRRHGCVENITSNMNKHQRQAANLLIRRRCQTISARALAHHDRGHRCQRRTADCAAVLLEALRGPHHPDEAVADDVLALDQTIVATAWPTMSPVQRRQQPALATALSHRPPPWWPAFGMLSASRRRVMYHCSAVLFMAGSISRGSAEHDGTHRARGLQGLGPAASCRSVQMVISDVVMPRERGQYQAYFSGVWMTGGLAGRCWRRVAEHLHWSMIFCINVPSSLARVSAAAGDGQDPGVHRRRKVDWLGGVLLMASAVVVMLVLTWGGNRFSGCRRSSWR